MSITKDMLLNWYSSMKKKIEKDSDNFWRGKLPLKVRNRHFWIAWFRAEVDLKKNLRKIRIIFDIENRLWKSEIVTFRFVDLERRLIWQKNILWKSAIFHSIKLPFDAEVAEKILKDIYYTFIIFLRNSYLHGY